MKHLPFFLISLILLCTLGCGSKHQSTEQIKPFASDTMNISQELHATDSINGIYYYGDVKGYKIHNRLNTDSANVYVDYDITIMELSHNITTTLASFIHYNLLDYGFVNDSDTIPPFSMKEFAPDYKRSQKENIEKMLGWSEECFKANADSIFEYSTDYNIEFSIHPVWLNDNYVTYFVFEYHYLGGMHGNYETYLHTFDKESGQTVNLNDIVKPDSIAKVRRLVAEHMASQNHFDNMKIPTLQNYLDSLNSWKNKTDIANYLNYGSPKDKYNITADDYPINDPGLNNTGLVFTYSKYHLTPGFEGCPVVVLTYDEVRDCLKEPFCNY